MRETMSSFCTQAPLIFAPLQRLSSTPATATGASTRWRRGRASPPDGAGRRGWSAGLEVVVGDDEAEVDGGKHHADETAGIAKDDGGGLLSRIRAGQREDDRKTRPDIPTVMPVVRSRK